MGLLHLRPTMRLLLLQQLCSFLSTAGIINYRPEIGIQQLDEFAEAKITFHKKKQMKVLRMCTWISIYRKDCLESCHFPLAVFSKSSYDNQMVKFQVGQ